MTDALNELVAHWVRRDIRDLTAYHVQPARDVIKLDAMENPYTWPDELRDDWVELVRRTDVNRYPDPGAAALTERLAEAMDVPDGMRVILGNGSDELIQMIAMALSGPSRSVLSVDPGFVMYRMIATFCGMRYVGVPLRDEDFSLDLPAVLQAMDEHQPAVVFLAYPNNPTGNLFDADAIAEIIASAPGLVVVDEAYAPFTDASFMPRLGDFDNLVIMRTVSKMGLAGLRLGMLAGPPAWLDEFDKVRLPYNINVLTQASAEFALRNKAVFDAQTAAIVAERPRVAAALGAHAGVTVYPSDANFLLVRVPQGRARSWFEGLRDRGVLIKLLDGAHPLLADCLRPTIGTAAENDALISACDEVAGRG
jgi:histidinol-phosphate aminotransferase